MLADIRDRKDLVSMTFENNDIQDVAGVCAVFKQLRNFERLESLNFRCNRGFDDRVLEALAEGLTLKKELRVSALLTLDS